MQPLVHLALVVVQLLFASLAIAGRFALPHFPAGALMILTELRQRREIPVEPVGE